MEVWYIREKLKTIKLHKGKKYLIEWNDTYTFGGWHDDEDIDKRTVQNHFQSTIGYYIKQKSNWIIIAMHYNPHEGFNDYGNLCWIPTGSILKINTLK